MKVLSLLLPAIILSCHLVAQDKAENLFGKVSASDFVLPPSAVIDSNSNAVIISDIGSTTFVGNSHHWFYPVYKRYFRLKILNENSIDELATIMVYLYGVKDEKSELSDVKAATYNLEDGKIKTTAFLANDIFETRLNTFTSEKKFALPAVKKGSIIEVSYTVTWKYAEHIPTWYFQRARYPTLYSEYDVIYPSALRYLTVHYGLDSFTMHKNFIVKNNHYYMGDLTVTSNDIKDQWIMKDVPALNEQSYIDAPTDFLDKIKFSLAQVYNGEEIRNELGATWAGTGASLLSSDYFGLTIEKESNVNLLSTADEIVGSDSDPLLIANDLYYYVKDNFTCFPDDEIFPDSDLYDINKSKKGSVADLNMLLIALLRQKGIFADPVILSTRNFGKNSADYPELSNLNYVICLARINGDTMYMDASRRNLGIGNLSINCYNGHARVISKNDGPIYFLPENIHEQKSTSVFIFNKEKGNLTGTYATEYGTFGTEKIREDVTVDGQKKYFDKIKSKVVDEAEVSNVHIDSLTKAESPATLHFDFKIAASGDILYFNPVILPDYKDNPFPPEQRKYPVIMPYPIDNIYVLNMEIPEGFTVDELPKSAKVSFNESDGFFEYLIQKDDTHIQFRTRIKLNKSTFAPDDYNSLRDFFAFVLKKYGEQIVLKKK